MKIKGDIKVKQDKMYLTINADLVDEFKNLGWTIKLICSSYWPIDAGGYYSWESKTFAEIEWDQESNPKYPENFSPN